MKIRSYIACFAIFILFVNLLAAQSAPYRQLTTNDGLPSNNVYGVIEDEDGFIWVYTEKGLAKYNGYEFKNFSIEDGLPVNDIFDAQKSSNGEIWLLGVENSVACIKEDSIYNIDLNQEENVVLRNNGDQPWYRSTSFKWNIKDGILEKSDINLTTNYNLSFKTKPIPLEVKNEQQFFGLNYTKNEFIEIGKDSSIIVTPIQTTNIERGPSYPMRYISIGNPYYLFVVKNGFLFVDEKTKKEEFYPWKDYDKSDISMAIIQVIDQRVFISTNVGLIDISASRDIKHHSYPTLNDKYQVQRAYIDRHENLWIGTKNGGLLFFSVEQEQTELVNTDIVDDKIFRKLHKTKKGDIIAVSSKSGVVNVTTNTKLKSISPNTNLSDSYLTEQGDLILSISSSPLISLSTEPGQKPSRPINPKLLNHSDAYIDQLFGAPLGQQRNIKNVIAVNEKDVYINHGFSFLRLFLNEQQEPKITPIDNRQRILYKGPNSKTIYTADKDSLYTIVDNDKLQAELKLPLISAIHPWGNSGLLIGTESSGLYKYTFDGSQINKIGDYGSISKIYINNSFDIYISSNEGIHKLSLINDKYELANYWGLNQGLPSLDVFDFVIDESDLYATTNNGIIKIDLNHHQPKDSKSLNQLNIEQVKINDMIVEDNQNFSYNQNDLSISYSLLDIKSFGNIKYKYKLLPIQTEWQTTSDLNAIFNNLSPNEYTFQLEANDSNNNKYKLEKDFKFTIKKPFWQTFGFLTAAILLTIFSFITIDKNRRISLDKKLELSKSHNRRIANLKLEALRSQMNPHFVFNALGAIQYYIQTHKIEEADNYLSLFANLMRKYLNSSTEQLINLTDELSLLDDYIKLEKMRFENMFSSELIIDPKVDLANTFIPSMVIQPYVENAVNHGILHRKDGKAKLTVSIDQIAEDEIKIQITDNGIGREKAKQFKKRFHKSKGMKNVVERIESLKTAELLDINIDINNNSNDLSFPGTNVAINLKKQTQWNTQLSS